MSEMPESLKRIRQKLAAKKITLKAPLSDAEIKAFETTYGILLPEGYRRFLLEIGNGGDGGPPAYGLLPLGKMPIVFHHTIDEDLTNLSKPFPFTEAWVWEDEANPDEDLMEKVDHERLILGDEGCAQYWALIVTGPQRDSIWNLADVGIQPWGPSRDFLSWYEYWLDGHKDWWATPKP